MENFDGMDSVEGNVGEASETKPMEVCSHCGFGLEEGQDFCPKCGTPKKVKNVCGKCGAELQEGQEFCSKCGQKVGLEVDTNVSSAIDQFNSGVARANERKKKAPVIIGVSIVIIVLVAIAGAKLLPKLLIDTAGYIEKGDLEKAWSKAKSNDDRQLVVDAYLADGDYEMAYAKAFTSEERLQIKIENVAAVQSAYSAENLKDPSSFSLRDTYYKEGKSDDGDINRQLVLYLSGANSYGASVSGYWLYTWSNDDQAWELFSSVSDLSEEEYETYDDDDEKIEKLFDNIARETIRQTMDEGTKLDKERVKRINQMFEDDKLDRVEMLDLNSLPSDIVSDKIEDTEL